MSSVAHGLEMAYLGTWWVAVRTLAFRTQAFFALASIVNHYLPFSVDHLVRSTRGQATALIRRTLRRPKLLDDPWRQLRSMVKHVPDRQVQVF